MRILGLDYGDKKIGLAFGDSETGVAVPLAVTLNRGEETLRALAARTAVEDIDRIVVGVPLATGGHHGPEQLLKTRAFINRLRWLVPVPVEEENESFTTAESLRLRQEEGTDVGEDALAAMLITRSYLERLSVS